VISHTNGPWRVGYNARVVLALTPSTVICTVSGEESDRLGNARAIAAVPELIDALRKIATPGCAGVTDIARRALQKAGL
jgi:hypothetical protein